MIDNHLCGEILKAAVGHADHEIIPTILAISFPDPMRSDGRANTEIHGTHSISSGRRARIRLRKSLAVNASHPFCSRWRQAVIDCDRLTALLTDQ